MSTPHVTYTPRPDATPEGEIAALASVYAFILQYGQEKRAAGSGQDHDGSEAKGSKHEVRHTGSIP